MEVFSERQITTQKGPKIKINGKICYNCWIASEKGRTVTYRPSGWASGRTSDNASPVDLNDNGVFKKFKFEQKQEVK